MAIIGESAKGLGENASKLSELMFSLAIPLVEDEDDSVRNNSVFALGEIVFHGKESMYKLVYKLIFFMVLFYIVFLYKIEMMLKIMIIKNKLILFYF